MGFFLLGLQFTHTDIGPLQKFVLTWDCISNMGKAGWAVFIVLLSVCGSILYLDFEGLKRSEVLVRYGIWAVLLVGFVVWNTKRLKPTGRELHIHHYCIAWIMLSFVCYQSEVLTICHGWAMGIFIEGSCRWGFDAIWVAGESFSELEDCKITKPKNIFKHTTQERLRWIAIKNH